jgi:hypothetical protein
VAALDGVVYAMGGFVEQNRIAVPDCYAYVVADDRWHATDSWQAWAPMLTPRHGMGAAVVADAIHVAGGGPMNGGVFQSSVHEVFSL